MPVHPEGWTLGCCSACMLEHWGRFNGLERRVRSSCTSWQHALGEPKLHALAACAGSMCKGSPTTGCKRRPNSDWYSRVPGPGCPSHTSSALCEPVCASFGARQPTQRTKLASPGRHPNERSPKETARRPDARHTLPMPFVSPSAPAFGPVSPCSAHHLRAQLGIPSNHCSK